MHTDESKLIHVAAVRRTRWDELDPQSPIVLVEEDYRHPANPAYAMPAGEICIDEGHGVATDLARANNPAGSPPWCVYPTPAVQAAIAAGKLVKVEPKQDTADLAMTDDAIASLRALDGRQAAALAKRFTDIPELVERIAGADDPLALLTATRGINEIVARQILDDLEARGLIATV